MDITSPKRVPTTGGLETDKFYKTEFLLYNKALLSFPTSFEVMLGYEIKFLKMRQKQKSCEGLL